MKSLELKVHPPIILALSLCLAYGTSQHLPLLPVPEFLVAASWFIGLIGVVVALAGIWQFHQAKTTVDPTKPEKASQLVTGGIYSVTRNPMYLAMQLIIIAAIFKFGNFLAFVVLPLFILYITQFQIKPEERIIEGIFGDEYLAYKNRVRRWL